MVNAESLQRITSVDFEKGIVKGVTAEGEVVTIPTKRVDKEDKISGAKRSLFPLLEVALLDFRQLLPPEQGYFASITAEAPYTQEKAVNILRKHEYSVRKTTKEVIDAFLEFSGTLGDVSEGSKGIIADLLKPLVHELYIATTEVSPKKTK